MGAALAESPAFRADVFSWGAVGTPPVFSLGLHSELGAVERPRRVFSRFLSAVTRPPVGREHERSFFSHPMSFNALVSYQTVLALPAGKSGPSGSARLQKSLLSLA